MMIFGWVLFGLVMLFLLCALVFLLVKLFVVVKAGDPAKVQSLFNPDEDKF